MDEARVTKRTVNFIINLSLFFLFFVMEYTCLIYDITCSGCSPADVSYKIKKYNVLPIQTLRPFSKKKTLKLN